MVHTFILFNYCITTTLTHYTDAVNIGWQKKRLASTAKRSKWLYMEKFMYNKALDPLCFFLAAVTSLLKKHAK
uniref:Putative secreted protein salivary gland overexpressed n=1 Tax=Rhipicephalus microplus TaxID=6941 RepID=A0A6M2DCC8_RHIMP